MTELAVYQPTAELAVPAQRDIDSWLHVCQDVIKLANVIFDTPFVPDGLRGSAPAVAAAILAGREMGLGPMTSLQHIHVIKGKPGQSALLMRALIEAQGHKWEDVDVTDTRAVVKGCRRGESAWAEASFTADQARKAGIDLGKYPQDKLYARATVRLARRKFADVIMGMPYSAEELEDGFDGEEVPAPAVPAAVAAAPAPRTAQRRTRQTPAAQDDTTSRTGPAEGTQTGPGAAPEASAQAGRSEGAGRTQTDPRAAGAASARGAQPPAPQDPSLPPLPGEEEEPSAEPPFDPDAHGTATRGKGGQLTALWTVLNTVFGFKQEEREQARGICEHVIGRKLPNTTGDMSWNEAKTVLDTLASWQKIAESRGREPRETLIAILAENGNAASDA